MAETSPRKLAAILAADIAGYSALMGADEEATVQDLKGHQAAVFPLISNYGGRIIDTAGDGILAEFPSALNAVKSALEIQEIMAGRNATIEPRRRMHFRIGINLGDVISDGVRLYGDGVNVAARLESIAEPGGICVSDKVHQEMRGKIAAHFAGGGMEALKNIDQRVQVWRWLPNDSALPIEREMTIQSQIELTRPQRKPALAVLPFANLSGDPDQAYFANGMAEDITTELSRFGSLLVVSRNSAFKYRGDVLDLARIGRELSVQNLLQGSVRQGGNRVRVTVQLIDVESGTHLWAERYDRKLEDVFAIQDEITETVASTVAGRVQAIGTDRAKAKRTENLEAYDYFLKGLDLYKGGVVDSEIIERAVAMFDRAIELDEGFARAYAWRACAASKLWGDDLSDEQRDKQLNESLNTVKVAFSLDEGESETHRIMGSIYLWKRDFERAEMHMRRAIALNPNDAQVAVKAGTFFSFAGLPEEAKTSVRRAIRLNPHHPDWYWTELGLALHTAGDYALAIDALLHCPAPTFLNLALLAASHTEVEQLPKARGFAKQLSELKPSATIGYFKGRMPYRRQKASDRLLKGLRKAGVRET